jgi:hypothetical protein
MKKLERIFVILLVLVFSGLNSFAQSEQDSTVVFHKIIKQNGADFTGVIISQDARELLLQTEDVGLLYIPKHEIEEIIEIKEDDVIESGGLFATRYFLTTNGFSIKKGDNYVQWNIFGPDFQFGVADNFTLGVMTSWVGMPIIGTAKFSGKLADKFYGGLGFLGGTGSWALPEYGLLLPFGFLSLGDRVNNINFTAGYAAVFAENTRTEYTLSSTPTDYSTNSYDYQRTSNNDPEGRALFSIAGMFRINDKFSFVFDSFFMLPGKETTRQTLHENWDEATQKTTYSIGTITEKSNPLAVLVPGIRFQASRTSSLQFGFTGIHFDGEFLPVPIPMIQWFKRI